MYGTLATLSIDPAKIDDLKALMDEWNETQGSSGIGYVGGYMLQPDSDASTVKMIAVFENEQVYRANAESPAQNDWYEKFRALLNADPIWEDGQVT